MACYKTKMHKHNTIHWCSGTTIWIRVWFTNDSSPVHTNTKWECLPLCQDLLGCV